MPNTPTPAVPRLSDRMDAILADFAENWGARLLPDGYNVPRDLFMAIRTELSRRDALLQAPEVPAIVRVLRRRAACNCGGVPHDSRCSYDPWANKAADLLDALTSDQVTKEPQS